MNPPKHRGPVEKRSLATASAPLFRRKLWGDLDRQSKGRAATLSETLALALSVSEAKPDAMRGPLDESFVSAHCTLHIALAALSLRRPDAQYSCYVCEDCRGDAPFVNSELCAGDGQVCPFQALSEAIVMLQTMTMARVVMMML